jgi:hypothetical protein
MNASTDIAVSLTVNGERVSRRIEARRHLIDFLRLDLGLMGSHTGCEHGVCGACTVLVDGRIVRGRLVLAALDGSQVETIKRWTSGEIGVCRRPSARNAAMWLLYARHAHDGGRLLKANLAHARADPQHISALPPLHRLSRHSMRSKPWQPKRNGKVSP